MTATTSTQLTYEDYASFPENGRRHEIIEGEHYAVRSPIVRHQAISGRIQFALMKYLENRTLGSLFNAPCDVILSDTDIVQPDILYIANEHVGIITEKNIQGAPDLLIEIISEGTRRTDEITKRKLYERSGVLEYWIVDPVIETVKIYRLIDRSYQQTAEITVESGGRLESSLLPGFSMDVEAVFRY